MIKTILIILGLLYTIRTFAQDTMVLYMDENYSFTSKDSAVYIREAMIKDNKYYITDKYIDGTIYSYYELSSLDPRILDGLSVDYKENNKIYSKGNYTQNKMSGTWLYFDDAGNADTVYYSETRERKIISAPYHSESKKTKDIGYQVIDSLNLFMEKNFHLPPRARDREAFQIGINCTIGKEGDVLWHQIQFPEVHNDIAQEIARIMEMFHFNHQTGRKFGISVDLIYGPQPVIDENAVFFLVEEMPEFQNKNYNNSFARFVEDNLGEAFNTCSGKAYVNFVVEKDGSLDEVRILKGIEGCPGYGEELERIIRSCTDWKPGKQRDKPVRVSVAIPVAFGN